MMKLTMRPAALAGRLYAYEQSARIVCQCARPGHLRSRLDDARTEFVNSWEGR